MAGRFPKVAALTSVLVAGALSACAPLGTGPAPLTAPPTGPLQPPEVTEASASARALGRYYNNLQADLLVQGLLRTDGGGPDTPYNARQLAETYETIAFFQEYEDGSWKRQNGRTAYQLRRWADPVRVDVSFGNSVPLEQRNLDARNVDLFAQRLSRVTRHPVSMSAARNANFHVIFTGYDDQPQLLQQLRQIVPNLDRASLRLIETLPRSTHCLMLGFAADDNPQELGQSIVIIRAEHPDILRKSCIHEEMAQGMGLINDSPRARPSIFNDNDEFAFLTRHDEQLLRMHYDRRLRIGMTLEEARPIIRQLAAEQIGAQRAPNS
ncbi:hypothetical protein TM5383_03072 [Thalassovita mediterranea]|uniref:DUF2927 domain-containing protein n=1 Tax=Thalassovita mediterranea TaxID=340021 RepID=A0A0P1H4T8_9RHOB|nr:hypothetical protein TM5383_03072 [Thalassovita mediterranea]SIS32611.1 Protein of unknown function [Thalassovita mediterranea]